jgi:hypothetical protein
MTNSTGNTNSNGTSGRQFLAASSSEVAVIPDLIYPDLGWGEDDYARLQARLDFFSDFIVLAKIKAGEITERYIVDPTDVTAALAGVNLSSGLLPDNCLFWGKRNGNDHLAVYVPPQSWLVSVRDEAQAPSTGPSASSGSISGQAWRVPLPGLVMIGHEYDYTLWAVTDRPTEENIPLYMAPCPNVHPEGVCRGNAPFPKAGPATIWQAVDVFFSSRFNRDLSNGKSQAYPDCVLDQWRVLIESGTESYPLDDLVKTDLTLRELFR